ncbi:hypothetical protein U9M48_009478 [Paspalum notatum var. saurae]|uniref:KIB1-4 beta-propeller domain-containing protein n=1 Tax=Paspalum notatum var. saurae TaxID=547442 RepID=A0AAQ3WF48_PASNO
MGESRDWASLESGPLHDVFTRLTADLDAFNFRHVCRGWSAAAGAGALIPRPWFVLRSATDGHCAFVRPTAGRRRRRSRVKNVRVGAPCVRGASRGWLALDDGGGRLLLRDPISRAEVPLPSFDDPAYRLSDVFLSDDPLAAPAGRWTAFAFFKTENCAYGYPGKVLAFCRPDDAEWGRFDLDGDGQQVGFYRGLEFFRGRAYVLLGMYMLAVCDVEARRVVACPVALQHMMEWESIQVSLVECGGNLLVAAVSQYEYATSSYCVRHRVVRRFLARVVKIDFEEAIGGAGMPVGLSNLEGGIGDYALFVAPQGHAFALPVRGFPAVRPGCVYHFAASITTKSVSGMVVTELLGQDPTKVQDDPLRKLPLAAGGAGWRLGCWFCPRSPSLETTPARRRRGTLRLSYK